MSSAKTVEKLRERAGVSYEEAREALESTDDDVLDALILLEKKGKVSPPRVGHYSTGEREADEAGYANPLHKNTDRYYDAEKLRSERRAYYERHRAGPDAKSRSNGRNDNRYNSRYSYERSDASGHRAQSFIDSVFGFLGKAFHIGNTTLFEVSRYDREIIKIPLTILIIAFILFFQVILILLPVGLFFGFRYKLSGDSFNDKPVNNVMDTAANAVDDIKDAFTKNKQ